MVQSEESCQVSFSITERLKPDQPKWETDFADTCQVGHMFFREKKPSLWQLSGCDDEGPQFINDKDDDDLIILSISVEETDILLGVSVSLLKAVLTRACEPNAARWETKWRCYEVVVWTMSPSPKVHFGLSVITNMTQGMPQLPGRFVRCKYGVGTFSAR